MGDEEEGAEDDPFAGMGDEEVEEKEEEEDAFKLELPEEYARVTNCTTQKQYVDLYAGPQYAMHFKYGSILV